MAKPGTKIMLAFGDVHFPHHNARAVEVFCRLAVVFLDAEVFCRPVVVLCTVLAKTGDTSRSAARNSLNGKDDTGRIPLPALKLGTVTSRIRRIPYHSKTRFVWPLDSTLLKGAPAAADGGRHPRPYWRVPAT